MRLSQRLVAVRGRRAADGALATLDLDFDTANAQGSFPVTRAS